MTQTSKEVQKIVEILYEYAGDPDNIDPYKCANEVDQIYKEKFGGIMGQIMYPEAKPPYYEPSWHHANNMTRS